MTNVETALRQVYSWFDLDRLYILRNAFAKDRVIRKVYVDLEGKRCIMSHLDNDITSRLKLQQRYPNMLEYLTTRVVIENWDSGLLTKARAEAILEEVIAERTTLSTVATNPEENVSASERVCAV